MMPKPGWTSIGHTSTASFYEIEPHVLAIVPVHDARDDEQSARESVELQMRYAQEKQHRIGAVVFLDSIIDQNSAARKVYRDLPDPNMVTRYALVGGTALGRAIATVFMGLHKPRVPTKFFAAEEEAIRWVRERVRDAS